MDAVVDDRLLVEELLIGFDARGAQLQTTAYWCFRACRAAVAGAGGHLAGPFLDVPEIEQQRAIAAMLQLPGSIGLPDPRDTVAAMVEVARRHPALHLLNLEAVAVAHILDAVVWLSPERAKGVLPGVLDTEHIVWETIRPS